MVHLTTLHQLKLHGPDTLSIHPRIISTLLSIPFPPTIKPFYPKLCVCDSAVKQIPTIWSRRHIIKTLINQLSPHHHHYRHPTPKRRFTTLYTRCVLFNRNGCLSHLILTDRNIICWYGVKYGRDERTRTN
jgi:hypothetical protein